MKHPPPQRLDYEDGSFHWVFSDDIPLIIYRKVEYLMTQCREAINEMLPSLTMDKIPSLSHLYQFLDTGLYRIGEPYYKAISTLIGIPDPEKLQAISRYSFFVQRFDVNLEQGLVCLSSRLELVMGEGCYESSVDKPETELPSSGDLLWDIETSIRLSFKHNAEGMINTRGLISCLAMLEQASEQMRMAQEEAEKGTEKTSGSKPKPQSTKSANVKFKGKTLDADYLKDEEVILQTLGIELPED